MPFRAPNAAALKQIKFIPKPKPLRHRRDDLSLLTCNYDLCSAKRFGRYRSCGYDCDVGYRDRHIDWLHCPLHRLFVWALVIWTSIEMSMSHWIDCGIDYRHHHLLEKRGRRQEIELATGSLVGRHRIEGRICLKARSGDVHRLHRHLEGQKADHLHESFGKELEGRCWHLGGQGEDRATSCAAVR